MNEDKLKLFKTYAETNIAPIFIEGIQGNLIENSILLPANCDISLLNGHYEDIEFLPPIWYQKLKNKEKDKLSVLVIDNLFDIPKEEQMKFYELLKYRKISTFELPTNCLILVTSSKINKDNINREIYSLLAHIES